MTSCHIRPPAVAGSFYPADPRRLRTEVATLLANAAIETRSSPPKALIAPHAGYAYSGPIAAAAFATVRERAEAVTRIVLIGPAHHTWVPGIAAPTVMAFETPLGSVPVDQAALATVSDLPFVSHDDAVHVSEHALEVELPFLQSTIGAFVLVPLLVGDATPQQVALILDRLWGGPETLIVVSSDLSHYLASDAARRRDAATAAAIERGDWVGLGPDDACGCRPMAGLLIVANSARLTARRLDLRNSGDTAGGRKRVVGYGAWAFSYAG
jgi:AmmeMemoRadiSam system protein B